VARTEGWNWLYDSKKWHYFTVDGKSLCGKWLLGWRAESQQGDDDAPENCGTCRRLLRKRKMLPATSAGEGEG
jgi:hypothetical protein